MLNVFSVVKLLQMWRERKVGPFPSSFEEIEHYGSIRPSLGWSKYRKLRRQWKAAMQCGDTNILAPYLSPRGSPQSESDSASNASHSSFRSLFSMLLASGQVNMPDFLCRPFHLALSSQSQSSLFSDSNTGGFQPLTPSQLSQVDDSPDFLPASLSYPASSHVSSPSSQTSALSDLFIESIQPSEDISLPPTNITQAVRRMLRSHGNTVTDVHNPDQITFRTNVVAPRVIRRSSEPKPSRTQSMMRWNNDIPTQRRPSDLSFADPKSFTAFSPTTNGISRGTPLSDTALQLDEFPNTRRASVDLGRALVSTPFMQVPSREFATLLLLLLLHRP